MHSRFVPASLGFLASLLMCKALLAASCWVDPDPAKGPASIKPDGKTQEELPIGKKFENCAQLVLVSGMIHVLYETKNGTTRKTCIEPNKPCTVEAGTSPTWQDLFTYHRSAASKKMDKEVSRLPGIPHGKVFSPEKAATFHMAKAGLSQWHLSLSDAGGKKPIYRQGGSDPVVRVPLNLLRPGGKYTLAIEGSNKSYKGGFDLLGGTEAEEIAKQIKQANADASATARAKKLDELIVLYENNLDYEVELLSEELKL